ncbi:MAG: ABC transporter permease [Anaerolineales bacterium]|nr:ABC transporter permease [Anaerolineales bacterium]
MKDISHGLFNRKSKIENRQSGLWASAWRRLRGDKLTLAAGGLLVLYGALAIGAPWIAQHIFHTTPEQIDLLNSLALPSAQHWLGTDNFGRDQFVRVLYGAQVSLLVGFSAAFVNLTIGILLGALAGFYGGVVDDVIVWLINTARGIPSFFLLLFFGVLFKPSALGLALIIGVTSWMGVARLVRGQVIALRGLDYILAGRAIGVNNARLIFRHILPNILPIVIVYMGMDVGSVILTESGLSYLGVGIQEPLASWGNMLTKAQAFFFRAPWLVFPPGLFIWSTVLALYLLADGLRDALDPRLKE